MAWEPKRTRLNVNHWLTLYTALSLALFSSMAVVASTMFGALSFRLLRLTVMTAVLFIVPSEAVAIYTLSLHDALPILLLSATVMAPVLASMAKPPSALPPVML